MEHIRKYHTKHVVKKSTFVEGVDVDLLIQEVLTHPVVVKKHQTNPRRSWYIGKFATVIGYRGTDRAECKWIVVLIDGHQLITAYPIPHPRTLKFMRHVLSSKISAGENSTSPAKKSEANRRTS